MIVERSVLPLRDMSGHGALATLADYTFGTVIVMLQLATSDRRARASRTACVPQPNPTKRLREPPEGE